MWNVVRMRCRNQGEGHFLPRERKAYRVVATTPVSGLNAQAQVRYRGMSVGRVTSIRLDPGDRHKVFIDVEVNSDLPVTRGTYAQLGMEGITGIAYCTCSTTARKPRRRLRARAAWRSCR